MIFENIKSGIKNIIGGINEGLKLSGYSRVAAELRNLSDKQLAEIGISRELLEIGVTAYPWREEAVSKAIPNNLTNIKSVETVSDNSIMPETAQAA